MIDRREFLRRSSALGVGAVMLGGTALPAWASGSRLLSDEPSSTRAWPLPPQPSDGSWQSMVPFGYAMTALLQDNTASISDVMSAPVDVAQGKKFNYKLAWRPISGPVNGFFTFRVWDMQNYYMLKFGPTQLVLTAFTKGLPRTLGVATRTIDSSHPALLTVTVRGYHFQVFDDATPGAPAIIDVMDSARTASWGWILSHYTGPGAAAQWDSIRGWPS